MREDCGCAGGERVRGVEGVSKRIGYNVSSSDEVVKLCAKEMGWKKSTIYTMIRRLCEHRLFQNVNRIVTLVMSEDDYNSSVAEDMVNDKFGGLLLEFVSPVMKERGISARERKELLEILRQMMEYPLYRSFVLI